MKKKILSFALACTLLIGGSINVFAAELPANGKSSKTSDVKLSVNVEKETPKKTDVKKQEPLNNAIVFTVTPTKAQLKAIKTLFNVKEYAEMYPDVVKAVGNSEEALWNHFVKYGLKEGRSLNKKFNVFAYRACYQDLQKAFGGDLPALYEHYATFGIKEKRNLISLEDARRLGIIVMGMNGRILVDKPVVIVPSVVSSTESSPSKVETSSHKDTKANNSNNSSNKPSTPEIPVQPEPKPDPSVPENPDDVNPSDDGHVHNYTGDYVSNNQHRMYCFDCNTEDTSSGLIDCDYHWTTETKDGVQMHNSHCFGCGHVKDGTEDACADINSDGNCDECGAPIETEDKTEHSHNLAYVDNKDGTHSFKCTKCDYVDPSCVNQAHNFSPTLGDCEQCHATE